MNIKNFCLMALVAVGTVTSLSGCGGGSDEDKGDGYVSAKKFAAGAVSVYAMNTRALEIIPTNKRSNKPSNSAIELPPTTVSGDDVVSYETTDSVLCDGSIGVRGGEHYQAELLYQVSGDKVGCIQPTVIDRSGLRDPYFLNACGFLSFSDVSDGDLYMSTSDRFVTAAMDSYTIQVLLNFQTRMMTVYTSASGFRILYYDENQQIVTTRVSDQRVLTAKSTTPYIVEKR